MFQEADDLEKQLLIREDEDIDHREQEDEDDRSVVQEEIGNI